MKIVPFAILASALMTGSALADIWSVTEGAGGRIKGQWQVTVRDGAVTGNATMAGADGRPLTYALSGAVSDGEFTINRVRASDNVACVYRGARKGDLAASGTAFCNGSASGWMAVPKR